MELDAAGIRRFQAGDDAQQAGLAAPGRAEEGHELAAVDIQVDVVERAEGAEGLADITDFDGHGLFLRVAVT
ncbi:hypothetical protein ppKF707_3599 [Metapseudomonas furukawaii]|nr:hypothetical protein ppKF707_3599 [Pseudomonas furukawaii]